jgi:hypothetical protein
MRKKAHHLLSFGKQTLPHVLSRIILLEQLYRAETITGFPSSVPRSSVADVTYFQKDSSGGIAANFNIICCNKQMEFLL